VALDNGCLQVLQSCIDFSYLRPLVLCDVPVDANWQLWELLHVIQVLALLLLCFLICAALRDALAPMVVLMGHRHSDRLETA
jgi:hypothetical protein